MVVSGLVVLFALGLVLIFVGLRGRIVSTGPHCRACRFDLAGVRERCPECGAMLDGPGAVRQGLRQRRRGMLASGLILAVIAVGGGAAFAIGSARGFNWNTVKPAWLLAREVKNGGPATATAAMTELNARLLARRLGSGHAGRVMGLALERQRDRSLSWTGTWGDYLETCRVRGLMSDQEAESYARHGVMITFETRPRTAEGDQLPVRIRAGGGRIGSASTLRLQARQLEVCSEGRVLSRGGGSASMGLSPSGWATTGNSIEAPGPPGQHTISAKFQLSVGIGEGAPPVASWEETFTSTVEVLPAGTLTVEVVSDESLRESIEKNLRTQQCEVRAGWTRDKLQASGMVHVQGTPIGLSCDVFWCAPDGSAEWKVGQVSFPATTGGWGHGYGAEIPSSFNLDKVDIVLRPSPRAAGETVNVFKIWGGEIRRDGVSVKWPDQLKRPDQEDE